MNITLGNMLVFSDIKKQCCLQVIASHILSFWGPFIPDISLFDPLCYATPCPWHTPNPPHSSSNFKCDAFRVKVCKERTAFPAYPRQTTTHNNSKMVNDMLWYRGNQEYRNPPTCQHHLLCSTRHARASDPCYGSSCFLELRDNL